MSAASDNSRKGRVCPVLKEPSPECYCLNIDSRKIPSAIHYCGGHFDECTVFRSIVANSREVVRNSSEEESERNVTEGWIPNMRKNIQEVLKNPQCSGWEDIFNTINDAITVHDTHFNVLFANKAAEKMLGCTLSANMGKCYSLYHGTDIPPEGCPSCRTLQTCEPVEVEYFEPYLNKFIEMSTLPQFDDGGDIVVVVHIVRDISERKTAEERHRKLNCRLAQAQKMESLGMLAGTVAHDFSNLLTCIMGNIEVALQGVEIVGLESLGEVSKSLSAAFQASESAAALTKQLLAFNRNQPVDKRIMDINQLVGKTSVLLPGIIGERIALTVRLHESPVIVKADPTQMEQIIVNLAVNARDAMHEVGKLRIETGISTLPDDTHHGWSSVPPEKYVLLTVSDSGSGMDDAVMEHIFEPFFTTKEQGTGIGLAIIYGIVKQHRGHIQVKSSPGKGSTFEIYLPATEGQPG
jgi:two-component system cell cycle sensor histidine kinase/response regulator CckA